MAQTSNQNTGGHRTGGPRTEKAVRDGGFEKKGGYPAGPKPAKGVPPVPAGLRQPRPRPQAQQQQAKPPQS
jgi:hypothetical protein